MNLYTFGISKLGNVFFLADCIAIFQIIFIFQSGDKPILKIICNSFIGNNPNFVTISPPIYQIPLFARDHNYDQQEQDKSPNHQDYFNRAFFNHDIHNSFVNF
jgi:hypothetical protein